MTDILDRHLAPSPDAAESAVGNETVILHLVNGTYYGLDPVGTRIWGLIKEGVAMPDMGNFVDRIEIGAACMIEQVST